MTVQYATVDELRAQLAGDQPNMSHDWDAVLAHLIESVSAALDREVAKNRQGSSPWSFLADTVGSQRVFSGLPGSGSTFLPIDDCVAVSAVATRNLPTDSPTALVLNTDYIAWPVNGLPCIGLTRINARWPSTVASVLVTARWGYGTQVPADVRQATIVESIRAYLAARAGNDDRLGITPFGVVVTSKAFVESTWKLISDYSQGGAFLRASMG